jgi:hypothetical protein
MQKRLGGCHLSPLPIVLGAGRRGCQCRDDPGPDELHLLEGSIVVRHGHFVHTDFRQRSQLLEAGFDRAGDREVVDQLDWSGRHR